MSLREMQSLLARLYTDANLRERFLAEPQKIGSANNLSEIEVEQIAQILPAELRFFAESLFYKRLNEVEKLLPLSREVLGENFRELFREFSGEFVPSEIKKHLADALGFAKFLERQTLEPDWARDLIRFEAARLEFHNFERRFVFRRFRYDVREISRQDAKAQSFEKRRTIAVWIRLGAVRHFVWTL